MICIKESVTEIKGSIPTLLSEYTVITKRLREAMAQVDLEEAAKKMLKRAYDQGFMNDEEIDKKIELAREELEKSEIGKVLSTLFGGMKHDAD